MYLSSFEKRISCVWFDVVRAEKLMLQMTYLSRGNFIRKSLVIADFPVPAKVDE